MVGLLHAMAFMMLLLVGWVIWNNKPLTIIGTRQAHNQGIWWWWWFRICIGLFWAKFSDQDLTYWPLLTALLIRMFSVYTSNIQDRVEWATGEVTDMQLRGKIYKSQKSTQKNTTNNWQHIKWKSTELLAR